MKIGTLPRAAPRSPLVRLNRRLSKTPFGVRSIGRLAAWIGRFAGQGLHVRHAAFAIDGLPAAFDGLRIAHLSDPHLDPRLEATVVERAIARAYARRPDLMVFTGDYVNRPGEEVAALLERTLEVARAPLGVYAVLGNHDYWVGVEPVAAAIRAAGVTLLRNGAIALARGDAQLYLAGLDDVGEGMADLDATLADVPDGECVILLVHEPDVADLVAADGRAALQLSGHTHAGQVRLPGIGPLIRPRWGKKYGHARFRVGGMWLEVSAGLGACYPPIRLNSPPELTVVTLRCGQASNRRAILGG